MSNQGTIRLKVTNGAPAIEKLWNDRFKLEFLCDNNSPKEDWYYDNISSILPDYGILQETNFGSGVSEDWEAIPASVYPDMRLVETEYVYIPSMGDKRVKLTYETLTASWVEDKDEDTDYELNGLKRVSRTFVALPATTYDKVVGTSTIDSNGTTLYLGSFKIEETEAKWSLSEIWLEAGELSREENSEDAKGSISITQIGGCAAAPAGYTVVNESKNNTQGFETCSRTFYKDNSELSRSNDYVGSQLAESIEVFSPTAEPTPTDGEAVLGNRSTSNVGGIPTVRYTFLKPSVLSQSEDNVGSQLAIVIESFGEEPVEPTGQYRLAKKETSNLDGIPTTRHIYLKNCILSKIEVDDGSRQAIIIESFGETPSPQVGYILAKSETSDFDGIQTKKYTYLKAGLLSSSFKSLSDGLAKKTYTWLQTPVDESGVLVNESIGNSQGVQTVTREYMEIPSAFNYTGTVPFTIPGIVKIEGNFTRENLVLEVTPPIPTVCVATIDVSYGTNPAPSTSGLYQPNEWASAVASGIGVDLAAISYTNTFSNHIRVGSGATITGDYAPTEAIPDPVGSKALMGQVLKNREKGKIKLEGPTSDPAGTSKLLSVSVDPAFKSIDGDQYYRVIKVTAQVPSRG